MEKQDADDIEYQALVQRHKAEIEASGMSQEELINLLARNLASYNFLCRSYENNCRQLEGAIKIRAQICDLLEKKNASAEEKFFAAVNALPKAVKAGMEAIRAEVSGRAKAAANSLHNKPGGSREKQAAIRVIWATGKYKSRVRCAEEEYAALDMSFDAARKALRCIPRPDQA